MSHNQRNTIWICALILCALARTHTYTALASHDPLHRKSAYGKGKKQEQQQKSWAGFFLSISKAGMDLTRYEELQQMGYNIDNSQMAMLEVETLG